MLKHSSCSAKSIVLDHINLVVSNLNRSVDFYSQALGFEKSSHFFLKGSWMDSLTGLKNVYGEVVFLQLKDVRFELLQYHCPSSSSFKENAFPHTMGLRHIAFCVHNMDRYIHRLKKKKVVFKSDPVIIPLERIKMGKGFKKIVYFFDPDHILLEMNEYFQDQNELETREKNSESVS